MRSASGKRELAASNHLPATHAHTHTHLTVPSNTRHGNGTAAIRGKEPFPSIEEETESEMKGRKK